MSVTRDRRDNGEPLDAGRREFLRSVVRYATAGVLLMGTGVLVSRRREGGVRCPENLACAGCARLEGCVLPAAQAARLPRQSREG